MRVAEGEIESKYSAIYFNDDCGIVEYARSREIDGYVLIDARSDLIGSNGFFELKCSKGVIDWNTFAAVEEDDSKILSEFFWNRMEV